MKHYYYSEKNEQLGPFTFEELRTKQIKKSTLVWTDGMKEWSAAETISQLKEILLSEPPPLPKLKTELKSKHINVAKSEEVLKNQKYDFTYEKETMATFIGFILLLIPIILKLFAEFKIENEESLIQTYMFFLIANIVIRILATIWVVNISSQQNRDVTSWGWFTFFFPSISLIIIGQLNKLKLKIKLDNSIPKDQQLQILILKAYDLKKNFRFDEALLVYKRIKELDFDYPLIDENIDECETQIQDKVDGIIILEEKRRESVLISYDSNLGEIFVEQKNLYSSTQAGNKVFQNGKPAKSGKYKIGFMWYTHIDNGVIVKVTSF